MSDAQLEETERVHKLCKLRIETLREEQGSLIKRLSAYQNEIEELQQRLLDDPLWSGPTPHCDICGIDTRTTGSHYHCANCGRVSSMIGHFSKDPGEDEGSFTCEKRPREQWAD